MRLALVDLNAGTVLDVRDFNPGAGVKDGLALAPIVESTSGSGPVKVGTVDTIVATPVTVEGIDFPRRVARVTTLRAKTAQEVDDEKAAVATTQADQVLAKALFQVFNDVRVLKGQATFSAAQFIAYLKSLL